MRRNWAGGGGRGRRWVAAAAGRAEIALTAGSAAGAARPAARW